MKDPYAKLTGLRKRLLKAYDAERLHKLRIALRRMRSTLRTQPEPEARRLRDDLGLLADATNAARDWDTLALYAKDRLKKKSYRRIEPRLRERCESAHAQVMHTLRSERWSNTMAHWERYARAHHDDEPAGEVGVDERDVARARERLAHRRTKALARDDAGRWHKVRIAVKDFRYQLDTLDPAEHRDEIRLCKRLQECLGSWHDCVVHEQLVRELAGEVDSKRSPRVARALAKLRHALEADRRSSLKTARRLLAGDNVEALLSPRSKTAAGAD